MPDREVLRIVAAFDSTQVSRGAHKAIRDIQAVGAAAEYVGRKQLTGVVQQMDKFLAATGKLRPTGQVIPKEVVPAQRVLKEYEKQTTSRVITRGPRAGQVETKTKVFKDRPIYEDIPEQIIPEHLIPSKASADLQEFRENLLKTAEAGSINEKQMQKFLTRLALLRQVKLAEIIDPKEHAKAARAFTTLEKSLAGVQVKFAGASHEARGMQAEMMGLHQTTPEVSDRLMKAGSAAQGLMLGMGLASGNIMSAAFSIIFLRFSIPKLTLMVGALVAGFMILINMVKAVITTLTNFGKAAAALEAAGQRLTSFFRSQTVANAVLRQADEVAQRTGASYDDLVTSLSELERYGLRTPTYLNAILDASAATGKGINELTTDFLDLVKSQQFGMGGKELQDRARRLAQELNLPLTNYTNTLQLAEAMQKRFAGSTQAMGETGEASWKKVEAAAASTSRRIGVPILEAVKPAFNVIQGFLQSIAQGFQEALAPLMKSGELKRMIDGLGAAFSRLAPYISALGRALGRGLVGAITFLIRFFKVAADAAYIFIRALKALKDGIVWLLQPIKAIVDIVFQYIVAPGVEKLYEEAKKAALTELETTGKWQFPSPEIELYSPYTEESLPTKLMKWLFDQVFDPARDETKTAFELSKWSFGAPEIDFNPPTWADIAQMLHNFAGWWSRAWWAAGGGEGVPTAPIPIKLNFRPEGKLPLLISEGDPPPIDDEVWKAWWGSWGIADEAGGLLSRLRAAWDKIDLASQWKLISTALGFEFDLFKADWDRRWGDWDVPLESGGLLSRLRYQWDKIKLELPPLPSFGGGSVPLQPGEPGYIGPGQTEVRAFGGTIPGTPGTRRWVLADAGEFFGGHPTFAGARQRGEEGGIVVNIDLRGATIADDATARRIAGLIGDEVGRALSGRKRLSLHPI